jgi:hypothetical protein
MTWIKQDSLESTSVFDTLGHLLARVLRTSLLKTLAEGDDALRRQGVDSKLAQIYRKHPPPPRPPRRIIKESFIEVKGDTWRT